jgi:hypothetical protein
VKRDAPFELLAGATEIIDCSLEAIGPGPFESRLHVFVDDGSLREIVLAVRGDAQAPAKKPKQP